MNAKKLRESITDYLKGNEFISDIDELDIETLIDNYQIAQEALILLKNEGPVVTIPNGNGIPTTKQNPALNAYHASIKMVRESALKLGLSRSDRIKLKIEPSKVESGLSKLRAGIKS